MSKLYAITLGPGHKWSACVGSGKTIRLTAHGDRANLSGLFFNAAHPSERYNMPDTLKAQHTARLTAGHILMSDQGKAMVSIVEDEVGWHDPLSGYSTRQGTDDRYGHTSYQTNRNEWLRSGEENLTVELFRHGLGVRDLAPPVNFFSQVACEADGTMRYVPQPAAGRSVTLRTEMSLLIVLSNTPNPLDPSGVYPDAAIELRIEDAMPVREDDPCLTRCGENRRAFENTWNAKMLLKGAY